MTDRTKSAAIDALIANRMEVVGRIQDRQLSDLLTEELTKNVFSEAWRLQYEEDIQQFQRAVRDLVEDLAAQVKL